MSGCLPHSMPGHRMEKQVSQPHTTTKKKAAGASPLSELASDTKRTEIPAQIQKAFHFGCICNSNGHHHVQLIMVTKLEKDPHCTNS